MRLYRFDTELNITGSYVIDGFADSSYYLLRSVRATADGGALVTGSVADVHMNSTDTRTKAWVAKVSADDLVLEIGEREPSEGWIFPNPGTEGFRLELFRPMRDGVLRIADATGRTVLHKRLDGIRADADTRLWAQGVYHVHVSDDVGVPIFRTTWIKQ